jgi:hypothetical protein
MDASKLDRTVKGRDRQEIPLSALNSCDAGKRFDRLEPML